MANDENGNIIDPNIKTNDDGIETILKEGDEGFVAPVIEDKTIKETPVERVARLKGMLKRAETDAGIDEPEIKKKTSKKSEEFDYGEKAFLISNGIKEADEIALVKDIIGSTGKSLDDVMTSKYFQAELKELRDTKIATNAVPPGSKRTGQSAQNTVEYWIAKGELPPVSDRKLRQEVVNARIKVETDTNVFTKNPVVK